MMISHRPLPLAGLAGLLLILVAATGCQRVAPVRTLPSWVRGVYIPMFKNHTFEPQIEEVATRLTQEAFLEDGRVDVVPKSQADLVLVVALKEWNSETVRTRGDYIARTAEVSLAVELQLYDPFEMEFPQADLGTFIIRSGFNTDTRSNRYDPEPDRKRDLLNRLAHQIVTQVINGFPATGPGQIAGAGLPQFRTPETIPVNQPLQARPEQDGAPDVH